MPNGGCGVGVVMSSAVTAVCMSNITLGTETCGHPKRDLSLFTSRKDLGMAGYGIAAKLGG